MTPSQKRFIVGGLLLAGAGLGLPRASYAAATCTNGFLTGTYNAEITSLSFMNVLSTLNTTAGTTGSTGGTGSTGSTGTTGTTGTSGTTGTTGTTGSSGIGGGASSGG